MVRAAACFVFFVSAFAFADSQHMKLVFEDNFETFDRCKWEHEVTMWGGGNGEFQIYSTDPANTYVRDNTLFIKPTLTKNNINPSTKQPYGEDFLYNGKLDLVEMYGRCTQAMNFGCLREGKYGILPPVMSGRIRTLERFSFRFGKMEIIAKMPVGDWMWPAIWFLPEENVYGGWPRSGEIDLVESRGNRDLRSSEGLIGIQRVGSALHWGPRWDINKYALTHYAKSNLTSNYGDHFHKYTLDWDENGLRFSVDDEEYYRFPDPQINENKNWTGFYDYAMENGGMGGLDNPWVKGTLMTPFDEKVHIILNVAVGGTNSYFPDDVVNNGNGAKPWNNTGPGNKMEQFWKKNAEWYPTWEGENAAMQVKSIRVYQMTSDPPPTTHASARETSAGLVGSAVVLKPLRMGILLICVLSWFFSLNLNYS